MSELLLAAEFPPVSRDAWLALVERSLRGASFEDKLVSSTYDRIGVGPLYERAKDARAVPARPAAARWGVMQRLDHPDPPAANAEALHDLENGATALTILFTGAPSANGYGLREVSPPAL